MMPFKKRKNLRKNGRIPICRLAKIQIPLSENKKLVQILNLSESGMSLRVTDLSSDGIQFIIPGTESKSPALKELFQVKEGDTLRFNLQLDPQHPEITISGRIAWIKRVITARKDVQIQAGVQFLNISDMDRKLIQVYVAAFKS